MRAVLATLLVVTASAPIAASAQTATVGDLLSRCEAFERGYRFREGGAYNYDNNSDTGICLGYFSAVFHYSYVTIQGDTHPLLYFCPPKGATLTQYIRIFLAYARSHPQNLHLAPHFEVMTAFAQAFPCKDIGAGSR